MLTKNLQIPTEQIHAFCQRWSIIELSLFGSVLRDDFRPGSDVDLLVTFAPGARWDIDDRLKMEDELRQLLGRNIDLVERSAVERSENYIRRRHILSSAEPVYVAR